MQPFDGAGAPVTSGGHLTQASTQEERDGPDQLRATVRFLLTLAPVLRALFRGAGEAAESSPSLTPRQMQALCVVYLEPSLSVSRLASRLGVALAGASQIVAQLAALGVVRREDDPLDHRRTVVAPGHRFEEVFQEQVGARLLPLERALAQLERDVRMGLLRGLDELSTLIGASSEQPSADGCWREQAEGRIRS